MCCGIGIGECTLVALTHTTHTHSYVLFYRCVVTYQDQNLKNPYLIPLGSGSGTVDEIQELLKEDMVAYALYRVVSYCSTFFICNQGVSGVPSNEIYNSVY